ncbi:hypothetical protein, partial [Klebsiella pneumoniae]|uniref:hypothetical protein n=1 Tax=Klebsiella pneumoniae TaxID=573 RepID=UPI001C8F5EE5
CKAHDIVYSRYSDSERRSQADKELEERAWRRFKAADASLGEKAAAWAVTTAMKAKTKFGGGRKKRECQCKRKTKGRGLYLKPYRKEGAGKKKRYSKKKNFKIPIK